MSYYLGDGLGNNNLNIMRLLAALSVIYGHASAITGQGPADVFLQVVGFKFIGGVAVDVFFVISGFLVTSSSLNSNGLVYYIISRVLRIYPALIACTVFTVFILGPTLTVSSDYWSSHETWDYLWHNATAYRTEYFLPGVFSASHDRAVNGSLWSLAIEVRLYVVVLLLAILGVLKRKKIFNMFFFGSLFVGYFSPNAFSLLFANSNHLHVGMMFLMGSFAWINRADILISPVVLLPMLFFAASLHGTASFGVAYSMLLPYLVLILAFTSCRCLSWISNVGDYSYGIYLYGWISQQIIFMLMPEVTNVVNAVISCVLATTFAAVSWHTLEKPVLALRVKFRGA